MGSTPDITIGIYVGFDEPRTLGPGNMETGGGNAVPIYERIAREVFKDKPPTPFRIPPGLRLVKWSYEGGTIDEVFKPGTEPGSGYGATDDRRIDGRRFGYRPLRRGPAAGGQRQASGPLGHGRDLLKPSPRAKPRGLCSTTCVGKRGSLHSSLRSSVGMTDGSGVFPECAPKPKPW